MSDGIKPAVRGGRNAFFADPDIDRLLAMLMRVLNEHWVLTERVKILEAVLQEQGVLPEGAMETFVASDEQSAQWHSESYALIKEVISAGQNIDNKNRSPSD